MRPKFVDFLPLLFILLSQEFGDKAAWLPSGFATAED